MKTLFLFLLLTQSWAMAQDLVTQIDQPDLLNELDRTARSPFNISRTFEAIHQGAALPNFKLYHPSAHNEALLDYSETYGVVVQKIDEEVETLVSEMKIDYEKNILNTYKSELARTAEGKVFRKNGNVTRIFDTKWLKSSLGYFTLTGIVNRLDRRDFVGGCGEVRLLYRLAYKFKKKSKLYSSRMPFTMNVVYQYPDDGEECQTVARAWSQVNLKLPKTIRPELFDALGARFLQLELNLQAARFPSDLERMKQRGFAGQAIYLMKVFDFRDGHFVPQKLENTPEVSLFQNPRSKAELSSWITQNLKGIDLGVYKLPEDWSAKSALSVSTLGSTRDANKPFNYLLTLEEADSLIQEARDNGVKLEHINSGEALRDRLNSNTCMGCHQTSSTAGFHFLGKDRTELEGENVSHPTDGNRLLLGSSAHFHAEAFRRQHYMKALGQKLKPNRYRPHPAAPRAEWTEKSVSFKNVNNGLTCTLNEHFAAGKKWSCANPKATCQSIVRTSNTKVLDQAFGYCVVKSKADLYSGLACFDQTIQSAPANLDSVLGFNTHSFKDKVIKEKLLYAGVPETGPGLTCRPSRIGVPLGRLYRNCSSVEMGLTKDYTKASEICAIVGGKGFEEMAKGEYDSDRYALGVSRGMLDTCKVGSFCREDYICQELPDFLGTAPRFSLKSARVKTVKSQGVGFCTPTYFLFQLRLDGHPSP